ncbi:peptide chain release factor N(5)-glutamine methyltransferase [Xanthobacter agilis]|uniref:Release factor glutamine methyltransferase n=1 Tax=Xanthobacter agilis TaxID=47492 RepID=A0ABU0L9K9_XANAG|nr:peptide chain release factor N(5)-glutamine methyltransferase [Xanthobacter agilis]MDQ0503825.1 release factor glutamine methyltransferase [Xanthobacter agilis]
MIAAPSFTVTAFRRQMAAELTVSGVEAPDLEARLLLAHALQWDRDALFARGDESMPSAAAREAQGLLLRRIAGEPVSRILGHREFWSLDFQLSPDTLVPRPDTEAVVEEALALFPERGAGLRILDLGTGSGAILAALLTERPAALGVGVDRAEGAARTARDNLAHARVETRGAVLVGDWGASLSGGFDLVVSNPPYITHRAMASLPREVRLHDPELALDGGDDGLSAYRAIIADLPRLLARDGAAVLELGAGQEAAVAAIAVEAGLVVPAPARRDLAGIPRALTVRRS